MRWIPRLLLVLIAIPLLLLLVLELLPGKWLARQIAAIATTTTGLNVDIEDASLSLFSLTPAASLSGVRITDENKSPVAAVGNATAITNLRGLFSEAPVLDQTSVADVSVDLRVDAQGKANWLDWQPKSTATATDESNNSEPLAIPAIRLIQLNNIQIAYKDAKSDRDLEVIINVEGSTSNAEQPLRADISGTLNDIPLSVDATAQSLLAVISQQDDMSIDVAATLGDTEAQLSGVIGDVSTFKKLDFEFSLQGQDLQDLGAVAATTLPVLPPFSLQGSMQRDNDEFILRRFDAVIGDSDLEGDVRLNPFTQPLTVYANVISTVLDLDDLAGLLGATPDPDETATAEQIQAAKQERSDGRLLPDNPIPLTDLATIINGEIAFRATEVRTELFPVDSIDTRLEFLPERLRIDTLKIGLADGLVEGSVNVDVAASPVDSTVELRINRVNLRQVMASAGLDNEGFGLIGGRAKYWLKGDTLADMAASADGGTFLLMTEGQIDALLTELAGIDLVESVTLLASGKDANTDIRCAYADLHSREGLLTLQTFVIDTDDTVFLADGTVDFNNEALDLTIEPHPKDVSLLASQTSLKVGGTMADPSILPGKALPLRAAAAAILATAATPAAALLPFIEAGTGQSSPYCSGLASSLDEAR
ncbi:AsmA family protein [Granulosicoccus antarcticus]|uniref:AsmA domain-containing protein n=1 Tax=Granulosicoccus antarcticus IMCC3135 TaxID=1192854 RepID=A0A2Z2NUQ6_9GAMM|nr:AsmA family protein [Granulosicoccus antarcticus]ASJ73751.1 hypothetical protein IMCC3135_18360 [Granulosicoccus antarcticus IMCC3135]